MKFQKKRVCFDVLGSNSKKFRSSKVNSGTALEALGWRLFFFPPGGPGPDDLSLQTAVDDMRTVQKTDCT